MPEVRDSAASLHAAGKQRSAKEESAVNREIASLLLNLASRTQQPPAQGTAETEAMDLSKYSRSYSAVSSPAPAPYTAARSAPAPPAAPAPATAASGLQLPLGGLSGAGAGLGSSYLLHNLIIGQIQSLTGTATSAPGGHTQNLATKAEPSPSAVASSTIPLLSGHIVAQLNSLLFSVHGLADKQLELSVQTQLAAIYTRLQEIVAMVSSAKQKESQRGPGKETLASPPAAVKAEAGESKQQAATEEQKITRQLEEYQRALYLTSAGQKGGQFPAAQGSAAAYLGARAPAAVPEAGPQQAADTSAAAATSRKSCEDSLLEAESAPEVTSVLENLRRRASKDGFGSAEAGLRPEKRSRRSVAGAGAGVSPPSSPQPTSSSVSLPGSRSKSGGKGGKGIRNRVFCGDCPGCLRNDDCGQCRYCRDKTKFGGQNRLRQKCLHRRCQMDTHRRSNGSAGGSGHGEDVSTSVYPGGAGAADLARYRGGGGGGGGEARNIADHSSLFTSLLGSLTPGEVTVTADSAAARDTRAPSSGHSGHRSDKWKAKHEAMLKLAVAPAAEHPSPEPRPKQQVFENKNLVITIKDALKENNENQAVKMDEEEEEARAELGRAKHAERGTKYKSADPKKEVSRLTTRSMKPVFAL